MSSAMFLVLLDVTVLNVALPHIRAGLGASVSQTQWIIDAYSITFAALLLAGGTIGDTYGHKFVVLFGLGIFAISSAAGGFSQNVTELIASRAVQGIGAALLLPGSLAIITHQFPKQGEQTKAIGIWASISSLALPAGPILGGLLIYSFGWRSIFAINTIVIIPVIIATIKAVSKSQNEKRIPLDIWGIIIVGAILALVSYGIISTGNQGFSSSLTLFAFGLAFIFLIIFVFVESQNSYPVFQLQLLKNSNFVGSIAVAGLMNLVAIGTLLLLSFYLQVIQHHSALLTGVELVPMFALLSLLAPISAKSVTKFSYSPTIAIGLILGIGGLALLHYFIRANTSYLVLLPSLMLLGSGLGIITTAVVATTMASVPKQNAGFASAVNNSARQSGGAFGIALFGSLAKNPNNKTYFMAGFHLAEIIGAGLWLLALAIAIFLIKKSSF